MSVIVVKTQVLTAGSLQNLTRRSRTLCFRFKFIWQTRLNVIRDEIAPHTPEIRPPRLITILELDNGKV